MSLSLLHICVKVIFSKVDRYMTRYMANLFHVYPQCHRYPQQRIFHQPCKYKNFVTPQEEICVILSYISCT